MKKIGHSGTLDPGAAGVLVLALGQATRALEFMEEETKAYRAECTFGVTTDSQDQSGNVLSVRACQLGKSELQKVISAFTGEILQVPPMVSAVKHKGQRLYALARKGVTVERSARPAHIHNLTILSFLEADDDHQIETIALSTVLGEFAPSALEQTEGEYEGSGARVMLDIECSRGTYVRTLCNDMGEALGCGAYMSFLLRTRSGPFRLADAYTLEELNAIARRGEWEAVVKPISFGLAHLSRVQVAPAHGKRLTHGNEVELEDVNISQTEPQKVLVVDETNTEICVADLTLHANGSRLIRPVKVFASPQN